MIAYTNSKMISIQGSITNVEDVRNKFLYSELDLKLF